MTRKARMQSKSSRVRRNGVCGYVPFQRLESLGSFQQSTRRDRGAARGEGPGREIRATWNRVPRRRHAGHRHSNTRKGPAPEATPRGSCLMVLFALSFSAALHRACQLVLYASRARRF